MATLLRKVWDSMSNRSNSNWNSTGRPIVDESSTGAFDHIPFDVFIQILKFLGPKEAARLSLVCKTWKLLVSDNYLWIFFFRNQQESWDTFVFAETHLRSGYPLKTFCDEPTQLSFMRIYGQREQVTGSVIIDGGSGYCKFGWSKFAYPSGRSSTFLEFGNIESPMHSRLRHFFATIYSRPALVIVHLQKVKFISKGKKFPAQQHSPASSHMSGEMNTPSLLLDTCARPPIGPRIGAGGMQPVRKPQPVKPSTQPLVISIPICHYDDTESAKAARKQLKTAIYSVLFEMNVPAVCAINQAVLALYAARQTSGIVVNIGFQATSVVPILRGKVMREVGVEVVGQGALKLTGFLKELMQHKGMKFESLYTVRTLKENLCYVAADYEAELSKDTEASFEVSGEGWFTLSKERFQTGEILFQPRMGGIRAMGLHQAIALCMDHCQAAEITDDDGWFKTVVLAGGTACLPGLPERLENELCKTLPAPMSNGIRVIPPPNDAESAWFGAKLISNVSTFHETWCITKKQFRQKYGRSLINYW